MCDEQLYNYAKKQEESVTLVSSVDILWLYVIISILFFKMNAFFPAPRSFNNPRLTQQEIADASEGLHIGILEQLKSKSQLPTVIAFNHTYFNFLFKDKGRKSNDSGNILLEKQDFIRCHFPNGWHRLIDSIGDGVQIDFPVKVRLFLSWSPKTHSLTGESITPCPRYRPEKLSISFCKAACSLT